MTRERIVGVITHNDQGGAQEALYRLCCALSRRGHQVSLWYLYKKGNLLPAKLPSRFVLEKEARNVFDYFRIGIDLYRMLVRSRPTAVISFLPLANVLTQTLAWTCHVPVRVASQRNPVQTYSWQMQLLDWYFGTCGSYTHNVANSSDVELSVTGYPWPYRYRTQIIQNGVERIPSCSLSRKDLRLRFNLEPHDVAIASVGRLTKQKNQIFLIQILGALKSFKLLLAGSGPEQSRLALEAERMGVAHRVQFLGPLNQSDTRLLLHASDIFAMPSLYEGHSNALLEAMSAGKAIVTSDIPSHKDSLADGQIQAGFSIPITDPNCWIATLEQLGKSAKQRRELGKLAQERAGNFTLDDMCSAFELIINS